jgi:hypothetical protein
MNDALRTLMSEKPRVSVIDLSAIFDAGAELVKHLNWVQDLERMERLASHL